MRNGYTKEKYLQIKDECHHLLTGEHKYITCPFCEAPEKKMHVTRTEAGYLFHCFRASCGKSGMIGDYYKSPVKDTVGPEKFNKYTGFLLNMPKPLWEKTLEPYGISFAQTKFQGIKFAPDENRIYFPIYSYLGYQIGETLKAIDKSVKPKNLTNRWGDIPLIHFPMGQRTSSHLVLVEDHISAIKLSWWYTSAALMGTHLSEEAFQMLIRNRFTEFTLFLDGDALLAAYKIANKYGSFAKFNIINTPEGKDPKDLPNDLLKTLVTR